MKIIRYKGKFYDSIVDACQITGDSYTVIWREVNLRQPKEKSSRKKVKESATVSTPRKPIPSKRLKIDITSAIRPYKGTVAMGAFYNIIYDNGEDHNLHLCNFHYSELVSLDMVVSVHARHDVKQKPCIWCQKKQVGTIR